MQEKLDDYFSVIFEPELIKEIIKFGNLTKIKKNELLPSSKQVWDFT